LSEDLEVVSRLRLSGERLETISLFVNTENERATRRLVVHMEMPSGKGIRGRRPIPHLHQLR
jgi:hypothetical protein